MNFVSSSPLLVLLYAWAVLYILMGVQFRSLSNIQKWLFPLLGLLLCILNHLLRQQLGSAAYGKLILVAMHLPTFLVFLYITKAGVLKTAFMILTALVFSSPIILLGNLVRRVFFVGSSRALLLTNLVSYVIMLLLVYFVFRKGFRYLLKHGDNRLFLLFSIVPLLYYIYVLAIVNFDFSVLTSPSGYIVRFIPSLEVFAMYFLLPQIYKSLSEKREIELAQAVLAQKLDAATEQITLLNQAQAQAAIYQHDMHHHLTAIDAFLSVGNTFRAAEYIRDVQADVEAIVPQRFCENESVNLLCSSFARKAEQQNIHFTVDTRLPNQLAISDTELCSILSNGLENALHAVVPLDISRRKVSLYCGIKQNKFLLEIRNPYQGTISMQDGLPVSTQEGHGYGCRSIQAIARRHGGLCVFEAERGIFTLRVAIPVYKA